MLILVFIIGFMLLWRMAGGASLLERLGFALPVGLALITVCMTLMDWVGIALSRTSMTVLTLTLLVAATAAKFGRIPSYPPKGGGPNLKPQISNLKSQISNLNLVWLLLFVGVIYLEYVNIAKCLTYPTYDRDSMAAFDTFGYVCAQEGTYLRMSLFEPGYIPSLHHAGSAMGYMPMLQLSYAYVYIFGAATSKAVPAFIYLGFLFGFYGLCRRKLSHTASMLAVMGVMLTPEMTSFASHSMTNVMHACVVSAAIIYLCLWIERREAHDLRLCTVLLAVNVWMRAEGIVFIGVAILLVAKCESSRVRKLNDQTTKRPNDQISTLQLFYSLLPFVLWTVCSHVCGLASGSALILHPFWDGEKMLTILSGIWGLMSGGEFYGWTFNLALIMLLVLLSYKLLKRKKDNSSDSFSLWLLCAILLGLMGYILVLYHVDYQWDSVQNVLAFSAKRFLFCFVPMAWYFSLSVTPMRKLAAWLEKKLSFPDS